MAMHGNSQSHMAIRSPPRSPAEYAAPNVADYVICELSYDSQVALGPKVKAFVGPARAARIRDGLNKLIDRFNFKQVAPLFGSVLKKKDFERRTKASVAPSAMCAPDAKFALAGFVAIVPEDPSDCREVVERLSLTSGVWKAYLAPRPVPAAKASRQKTKHVPKVKGCGAAGRGESPRGPAAGSRNFEPAQGYLCDAPDGIGASGIWARPGAVGKGIPICDIEGAWHRAHEDLPRGLKLIGGRMIDDLVWRDHGTAVLGEMVSVRGNVGCVGISHEAKAVVHSMMIDSLPNPAGAIVAAANVLRPGDVLLIELQAPGGPDGKDVAMQFWDPIFAAIRFAVTRGIVVVEAAGNGDENFDRKEYAGTGLQTDSGAIVVGAGIPPTNYFDAYGSDGMFPPAPAYSRIGPARSRIWFSNYGRIVDVQGWGWHVTTLAYGDAQGGRDENRWYTHRFRGTSSASPIVAGAVACLQGFAKLHIGRPLTPLEIRDILKATGTPQADDAPRAPLAQCIGPLPDLAAALSEVEKRFGS